MLTISNPIRKTSLPLAAALCGAFMLSGCPQKSDEPKATYDVLATVATTSSGAVNALILGTNTQWVDQGDGLINADLSFNAANLASFQAIAPSMVRYPGGTYSDAYNWSNGMGVLGARGQSEKYPSGVTESILFGTKEFLELCNTVGAEPLITVNIGTGTSAEAAGWVQQTNITRIAENNASLLPKVKYWEIGNEPYLIADDARPAMNPSPAQYVTIANSFIPAMKAVDPTIMVGLPLRSDNFNGTPATPYPGYNATVLGGVTAAFDYVSVHNAYLPYAWDNSKVYTDDELFKSAMAASRSFLQDLNATRTQIQSYYPAGKPIALTEYSTFFTINGSYDARINSFVTGLYIADHLAVMSEQPDIIFANHWSLIGNWHFGTINDADGMIRPAGKVMAQFKKFLKGNRIAVTTSGPRFSNTAVGFLPAYTDTPTVKVAATLEGATMRLWIINKGAGSLKFKTTVNQKINLAVAEDLSSNDLWSANLAVSWQPATVTILDSAFRMDLKPYSVSYVQLSL